MNISIKQKTFLMLAMALLLSQNAMALKVYQWTDAEGVVHFSDTPPPDDVSSEINETELVNFAGDDADSDEYSIVNQLEQMIAWRRQMEEDQRAWKQLELEEERLALEQQSYQPTPAISANTNYPHSYYPRAYYFPYPIHYPQYTKRHGYPFSKNHFGNGNKGHHRQMTSGFSQFR